MVKRMALMDWRAMKYYHLRVLLLPLAIFMLGLVFSSLVVMPACVMLFVFFSINTFAVEEKGALHNLYLTLPVARSTIVSGRFLAAAVMGLCGIVFSVPVMLLVNYIGPAKYFLPLSWYVFILAVSYLLFSLFVLAMYPVLFKLGYVKGKFWGFILPAIFMGVLYGGYAVASFTPGNEMLAYNILLFASEHMLAVSGGIALVASLLLGAAYLLSRRIYARRDF